MLLRVLARFDLSSQPFPQDNRCCHPMLVFLLSRTIMPLVGWSFSTTATWSSDRTTLSSKLRRDDLKLVRTAIMRELKYVPSRSANAVPLGAGNVKRLFMRPSCFVLSES